MRNYYALKGGVIYLLKCLVTGDYYVGQTTNVGNRFCSHMYGIMFPKRNKGKSKLDDLKRKYPSLKVWNFQVLEEGIPKERLNEREVYWINFYDSYEKGLNSTRGNGIKKKKK